MSVQPRPRFSIIIPCFNQGAFLAECLESLRAQTLPPYEVIVVDDGSTDPYSVRRMDELCVGGIRLIRQENRGLSGARNTAVRAATGDWILPLDADDRVEPNALEAYARAIAQAPEVAVWYPDIHYFGNEHSIWRCFHFNPWRQLWENQMTCSSAIHRSVFDAGILYNERMRQGYEDWEFFVHACAEKGFVARSLGEPVFRYRRWGYSMLSASDSKRTELVAQLHGERPIYADEARLMALKREHNPYLGVAAEGPQLAGALAGQHFQDFRVVDDTGRVARQGDLSVFRGVPCSRVLVSLADAPLAAALEADPFLLEKAARTIHQHNPSVVWLVTTDADGAWPGFLLSEREARSASVRCVGFVLSPLSVLDAPDIPRRGGGLTEDLALHIEARIPGTTLTLVVGSHLTPSEGVPLPGPHAQSSAPRPPTQDGAPSVLAERKQLFHLGAHLIGRGVNRLAQGALGQRSHERLLQSRVVRGLRSRLLSQPSAPVPAREVGPVRPGPLPPEVQTDKRVRDTLWYTLNQPPRHAKPAAPDASALLVVAPSLAPGPASRALAQQVRELARHAPGQRRYLLITEEEWRGNSLTQAQQLRPHLAGAFSLPALSPHNQGEVLAQLTERLGVAAVLICDSRTAFEALPALRRLPRRVRIVAQAHALQASKAPERASPCAHAAARFNNLLDAYAVSFEDVAKELTGALYVSSSKVHVLPPALDLDMDMGPEPRRALLEPGRPARVVCVLPRDTTDDKALLFMLDVAHLWKRRHEDGALRLQLVTQGSLPDWLPDALHQQRLEALVEGLSEVSEVLPLAAEADCVLLPPGPGLGLLAVEAMSAGVPVIGPVAEGHGLPAELAPRLAWAVENPKQPLDYLRGLESLLDDVEAVRARAELVRAACCAPEPRALTAQRLDALLFPPAPSQPVRQRAAS